MPRSGSLRLRSELREGLDLSWPRMMIWALAYASVADGQPIRAALRRLD